MNRRVRCGRRRRSARHHATAFDVRRRPRDVAVRVGGAEVARMRRRCVDVIRYLRAAQRSFRKMLARAINGLAVHERIVRCRGDRMHVVRVGVIEVAVAARVAVKAADKRVMDVDVAP